MSWYTTKTAGEEKAQAVTGPGKVLSLFVANLNAAARWVWVYDAIDDAGMVPANLLVGPFPLLPTPSGVSADLDPDEVLQFKVGLRVAASTSGATYTASAAADLRVNANTVKVVQT